MFSHLSFLYATWNIGTTSTTPKQHKTSQQGVFNEAEPCLHFPCRQHLTANLPISWSTDVSSSCFDVAGPSVTSLGSAAPDPNLACFCPLQFLACPVLSQSTYQTTSAWSNSTGKRNLPSIGWKIIIEWSSVLQQQISSGYTGLNKIWDKILDPFTLQTTESYQKEEGTSLSSKVPAGKLVGEMLVPGGYLEIGRNKKRSRRCAAPGNPNQPQKSSGSKMKNMWQQRGWEIIKRP